MAIDEEHANYDEDEFHDPREWFNEYDSWMTGVESLPDSLKHRIPELTTYQEDLIIDLDDDTRSEVQRWATVADSFCTVSDPHGRQYNLDQEWNTQSVNELLRLNNSWWCNAKDDEIEIDLAESGLPQEVQALLIKEAQEARLRNANPNRAKGFKVDYRTLEHASVKANVVRARRKQ